MWGVAARYGARMAGRAFFRHAPRFASRAVWNNRGAIMRHGPGVVRAAGGMIGGAVAGAAARSVSRGRKMDISPGRVPETPVNKQGRSRSGGSRTPYPRKLFKQKGSGQPWRWQTRGNFQGKFKRMTRKSGRGLEQFNKKGFVFVNELHGTVTDPNVVYVLNQCVDPYQSLKAMNASILRKLFEKAGFRITGFQDRFNSYDNGTNGVGELTLTLVTVNDATGTSTVAASVTLNATTNCTIQDLVDTSAIVNVFMNYCSGYTTGSAGNASNLEVPLKYILYANQDTTTDIQTQLAEILFDEIHVTLFGKSELKIQNRTKAADSSADATDVSNNPLQGRSYLFQGIPRVKIQSKVEGVDVGAKQFNAMSVTDGFIKELTGTLLVSQELQDPVPPGFFWNCKASAKIRLEPGAIKHFSIYEKKSLPFLLLLKRIRLQYGVTDVAPEKAYLCNYSIFKTQMVGLEDVINVNLTENISIAYECERTFASMISVKKKSYCKTWWGDSTFS